MPWNEPGGNGNNSPPDLDKIIGDFFKKIGDWFKFNKPAKTAWQPAAPLPRKDWRYGVGGAALVIFLAWFLSGFFIVNPAEQAVILRFGKFNQVVQPGLHWIARFVESKYLVDVQKIYSFSLEGDFITKSAEDNPIISQIAQPDMANSADQSKNLVNVELNVQYRVIDPRAYLFNIVSPDDTMQKVAADALSEMIGQMKLDDVLTTGREMLSSAVFSRIKQILANYNAGLEVVGVNLRKVQAPDQVRAAFSDVNRADQDRATTIQQAQAYASKVVPLAEGEAARITADANGYRQQVVLLAQANTVQYQALLQAYQQAPDVTRERLYLDTMQNVLQHTSKVLVSANAGNNLLYLPLDKLMRPNPRLIEEEVKNETN